MYEVLVVALLGLIAYHTADIKYIVRDLAEWLKRG